MSRSTQMLDPADQQQVDRALTLVRDVLGEEALAVYLFGSAVRGGLRPESDIDLLVVSKRRTTHTQKRRLIRSLLAVSGRTAPHGMWRRIELTIVVERDIKPWRYPPSLDFQYGDWLRTEFESGNVEPWSTPNPDLAVLLSMVVLAGMPLFGPPPSQLFDPIPNNDLIGAMLHDIDRLKGAIASDTRNVILTFARMWSTVATGIVRSKDAAAGWALERLPEAQQPVLARARAIYLGDQPDQWDDLSHQIGPHADWVIAEIRRLARPADGQL